MTLIWAHARSSRITAHNTLEAFSEAVAEGAEGLELDVHMTADNRLVCCHDGELQGEDGSVIVVGDSTYADLAEVRVGDDSTGPTRIPLLSEVYELLAPTDVRLNIEAKNLLRPYPGIAETLVESVAHSQMSDRIVVSSFHHRLLGELRDLDKRIALAALYADGLIEPWVYMARIGVSEVHPHYSSLAEPGVIEGFHRAGMTMRAWTVDDPSTWINLIEAGVHGIITNHPAEALEARALLRSGTRPTPTPAF